MWRVEFTPCHLYKVSDFNRKRKLLEISSFKKIGRLSATRMHATLPRHKREATISPIPSISQSVLWRSEGNNGKSWRTNGPTQGLCVLSQHRYAWCAVGSVHRYGFPSRPQTVWRETEGDGSEGSQGEFDPRQGACPTVSSGQLLEE